MQELKIALTQSQKLVINCQICYLNYVQVLTMRFWSSRKKIDRRQNSASVVDILQPVQ